MGIRPFTSDQALTTAILNLLEHVANMIGKNQPSKKHIVLLEVWTSKDNKELLDMIAQRTYTLQGVEMADAKLLATVDVKEK